MPTSWVWAVKDDGSWSGPLEREDGIRREVVVGEEEMGVWGQGSVFRAPHWRRGM